MPATLATVASILKEVYEPQIREQMENETVALKRIERSSDGVETTVGGKYVTFPIHTRRNAGIGARNEMELLPTPGQQGYANARVGLKYLYGGIQVTGQLVELADKNFQAFSNALDREIEGLKADLAKDTNRQVYGDGSGTLGTVTADGINTVTLADAMYVQLGMQVDIVDGTTLANATPTVKASNRQVTSVDPATGIVTYSGADATAVAGDVLVRTGNGNREWTGFKSVIRNTGTLYNVDPTVEPLWKAQVDTAGANRAVSEGLMISMADTIRAAGGKTTAIYSNLGVRRAYWNLLVQQRQFVNTKDFGGGFTGLSFTTDKGEIPFVVDIDAPKNLMYFVNEKEITYYRESDWSWMDRDGSMFSRIAGYDAYEARMYQYSELGIHRRNSFGVIEKLTEA
jgi:hypothetical protein